MINLAWVSYSFSFFNKSSLLCLPTSNVLKIWAVFSSKLPIVLWHTYVRKESFKQNCFFPGFVQCLKITKNIQWLIWNTQTVTKRRKRSYTLRIRQLKGGSMFLAFRIFLKALLFKFLLLLLYSTNKIKLYRLATKLTHPAKKMLWLEH